jgi:hypothetical protein
MGVQPLSDLTVVTARSQSQSDSVTQQSLAQYGAQLFDLHKKTSGRSRCGLRATHALSAFILSFVKFLKNTSLYIKKKAPISIAERSKASTVFGPSNVEIAGSNPARGMDVCLRFSVLCCPVCR